MLKLYNKYTIIKTDKTSNTSVETLFLFSVLSNTSLIFLFIKGMLTIDIIKININELNKSIKYHLLLASTALIKFTTTMLDTISQTATISILINISITALYVAIL